jgi:hypothetical protein
MIEMVQIERLIGIQPRIICHGTHISVCVVFDRRRPAIDDLADGTQIMLVLIGNERSRQRTDAVDGRLEGKKLHITLTFGQTLPRITVAPDIARVVVADAARVRPVFSAVMLFSLSAVEKRL